MNQPSVTDDTMTAYDRATTADGLSTDPDAYAAELLAEQQRAFGGPACPGVEGDAHGLPTIPMFSAQAESEAPAAAETSEIVPALPPLIAMLPKLSDGDLVACGADAEGVIARTRMQHEEELRPILERHAAKLAPDLALRDAVRAEIERRTIANFTSLDGTTSKQTFALASAAGYEAGIEVKREQAKFIDVLRRLEGKVTPDEFKAAVYQEPMPEPEKLPWKANLTKLKALSKKYGEKSEIGQIIAAGTEFREVSRRVFFREIPQEPKNVTGTGEAA